MLKEMKDQCSEVRLGTSVDFRTAKSVNNDLVDILRALTEIVMRTDVGREIKERFMDAITYELERSESFKIVL